MLNDLLTFENKSGATFRVDMGDGVNSFYSGIFNNEGTVEIIKGVMWFYNEGNHTGIFTVANSSEIYFSILGGGGVITFSPTSSVTGLGKIWFDNAIVTIDGNYAPAITNVGSVVNINVDYDATKN